MGNGSVIKPGDLQYMSAGPAWRHSEFNASKTEPVHLYKSGMLPRSRDSSRHTTRKTSAKPKSAEAAAGSLAGWA